MNPRVPASRSGQAFTDWDQDRRTAMLGQLIDLIATHTFVAIGAAIVVADYKALKDEERKRLGQPKTRTSEWPATSIVTRRTVFLVATARRGCEAHPRAGSRETSSRSTRGDRPGRSAGLCGVGSSRSRTGGTRAGATPRPCPVARVRVPAATASRSERTPPTGADRLR